MNRQQREKEMRYIIEADQISSSGTISVNASDSGIMRYIIKEHTVKFPVTDSNGNTIMLDRECVYGQMLPNKQTVYDYSPWCIVTTGRQYMTIESLDHEDNLYPTGEHHIWNGQKQRELLKSIQALFENRLLPMQYGQIRVWTNPNSNTQIPWPQQETKNND